MEDLFRTLAGGARFKKKRPLSGAGGAAAISISSHPHRITKASNGRSLSSSLDFFKSAGPSSSSLSIPKAAAKKGMSSPSIAAAASSSKLREKEEKVKRKRSLDADDDEEEEDHRIDLKKQNGGTKQKLPKKKQQQHHPQQQQQQQQEVNLFTKKGKRKTAADDEEEEGSEEEENDNEVAATATDHTHEEEIRAFRRRMRIVAHGQGIPDCIGSFQEMEAEDHIKGILLRNIEASKWLEPTPIQMQSVPTMAAGRDILASAPTGSGKTAAFVIPTLIRLEAPQKKHGPRALLLAPTRELAAQIHREVERLAAGKKFRIGLLSKALAATGKASGDKQVLNVYDVLVATPMRLVSVLREEAIDLSRVEVVVLDEADKLFELGREGGSDGGDADKSFLGQVDEILATCSHAKVQRALFSATLPPAVEELANTVLRDPIKVTIGTKNAGATRIERKFVFVFIGTKNAGATSIEQKLVFVGKEEGKLLAIRQLIREGLHPPILIFLQSKDRARELFHELVYDGVRVDVMHAERTPEQRDALVRKFRTGEIWVLICTDLMARGLDFKAVNMVINYDLPQSAVSYIHRIGRTGRAGRPGLAVTLFTEADMAHLRSIANVMKLSGCEVPEWMLTLKKEKPKERRKLEMSAPRRSRISTTSKWDKKKAYRKQEAIRHSQQGGGGDEEKEGEEEEEFT